MRQLPLPLRVNPELGFNEFHPGSNGEVIRHLKAAAAGVGESLIYLWGPPKVGKSHLLNAFCKCAAPVRSVALLNLEEDAFQDPCAFEGLEAFDALCLDNLEAISGDADREYALFVLFNQLRDRGHVLIVSARQLPDTLGISLDDLRSRLNWGLTLRLHPLTDETLAEALCLKARAQGIELGPEASRYLTHRSQRTLEELLKVLDQVDAVSLERKRRITIPLIREILRKTPK